MRKNLFNVLAVLAVTVLLSSCEVQQNTNSESNQQSESEVLSNSPVDSNIESEVSSNLNLYFRDIYTILRIMIAIRLTTATKIAINACSVRASFRIFLSLIPKCEYRWNSCFLFSHTEMDINKDAAIPTATT